MIPSVVAAEVLHALCDFLLTGFKPSNPELAGVLDDFLAEPSNLARGPYLSLALPFRKTQGDEPFPEVPLGFTPYDHQRVAMERLAGVRGESTLVATGTGSGKTECYLQPILDYCRERTGRRGIKAILIYPMNALATDQAARIAAAIGGNKALHRKVTAGLYVGGYEEMPRKTMTNTHVVTDRETLRDRPPDILLTNYKMLDYLMIRPSDQRLWRHNGPGTLRYLVVDELHTFDGAQGTDLACLIRRLRARLRVAPDGLVCVGTSATLGTGDDEPVREYASRVFNQKFGPGSVVGEMRQRPEEFLGGSLITGHLAPAQDLGTLLDPRRHSTGASYLRAAHRAFFGEPPPGDFDSDEWRVALARRLREHTAFRNLLQVLGGEPRSLPDIAADLRRTLPVEDDEGAAAVLDALCALISMARLREDGELRPFLDVGVHLWIRELARMVCSVWEVGESGTALSSPTSRLRHSDDLQVPDAYGDGTSRSARAIHLPLIQCRECRVTGWAAVKRANQPCVELDLRVFYNMFFQRDVDVRFLFPGDPPPGRSVSHLFCGACGKLATAPSSSVGPEDAGTDSDEKRSCSRCESDRVVQLHVPDAVKTRLRRGDRVAELSRDCPYCHAREALIIFGARAASLTSVLCSQTFASRHNDDPKVLAFSDNVQNAAHRAGFVAARSRQTHTRASIAQVVAKNEGISLGRLPRLVAEHWQEREGSRERFAGEHIADDRRWMRDMRHLEREGTLPPGSNLPALVARRLAWETLRELTFGSGIGRTLERTGAAAIALDRERVEAAVRAVHTRIREEVGGLRGMGEVAVRALVLGVLRHMKDRGAVRHELMSDYLSSDGNQWATWHRNPALPRFGPRSLIPVFPICPDASGPPPHSRPARVNDGLEEVHGWKGRRSWYRRWCESVLAQESPLGPAEADHVLRLVFGALDNAGLATKVETRSWSVWALDAEGLTVTTEACLLPLDGPGRPLTVSAGEADLWVGVPRLDGPADANCYGSPQEPASRPFTHTDEPSTHISEPSPHVSWFGRLYRHGRVRRIVAAEHTALVEREEREQLQRTFAKPHAARRPWEPNLVSATPTLELGIDIGDLSTVTLCSVPPATANYRQRAGRAGRRDGNALVLTVVNAEPHDLYFYAEPLDMLAGGVDPPGIFLDAVAVLERQLTAYCLDSWVASGVSEDAVPQQIGTVLTNVEQERHTGFPYPFFDFVRSREEELIAGFLEAFAGDLLESSQKALRRFLLGDLDEKEPSLILKILSCLDDAIKERRSVAADIRSLGDRIRRLKQQPPDEATKTEIHELENTRKGLRAVHRKINGRDTFNFLTDEGLVPNYAFPEEGVKLRSVILHRRGGSGDSGDPGVEAVTHEYARPAAVALGEFAPENRFYARAHQVKITRVDTRVSKMERWRMCPTCVYAERVDAGDIHTTCPRCGDLHWQDRGQRLDLIRLTLVHAVAKAEESRIDDQRDDREHLFYVRSLVADFDQDSVQNAYAFQRADTAFGFEYIPSATFREINFGRLGQQNKSVRVAGVQLPREGFRICRRCGTVNPASASKPVHMPNCPGRHSGRDDIVDCLYLYREFKSEAIRMLLPGTAGPDAERCERSFVAALQLGLRHRFGGEIGHLRAMTCSYPSDGSDRLQRYVLLYDIVPGGTGYLKDRMTTPEKLLAVFEAALTAIEGCSCNQDPEKDGCHRCVLGYRRSRDIQHTSRETAREMLRAILSARDRLERVEGLRKVPVVVRTESVLEERFVAALRRVVGRRDRTASLRYDLVDGKPGYVLHLGAGGPDAQAWYVVPQIGLGEADGVSRPSRPDFLMRPARASAGHPPVAVFLDGFEFHRDRTHDDSVKRMALARAGFVVWSATWDDVAVALDEAQASTDGPPGADPTTQIATVQEELDSHWKTAELRSALGDPAVDLLGRYLAEPNPELWRRAVFTRLLGEFDPATMGSPDLASRLAAAAGTILPEPVADVVDRLVEDASETVVLAGRGPWRAPDDAVVGGPELFLAMPPTALQRFDPAAMLVAVHLHDDDASRSHEGFRAAWNDSLRIFNLLQFLPQSWWSTTRGREADMYDGLPEKSVRWSRGLSGHWEGREETASGPDATTEGDAATAWTDALRFSAPEVRIDLQRLSDRATPAPEVGFELVARSGTVLGEAELAWPEHQVAVLMTDRGGDRGIFESCGWRVLMAPTADLADSIADLLTGDPT